MTILADTFQLPTRKRDGCRHSQNKSTSIHKQTTTKVQSLAEEGDQRFADTEIAYSLILPAKSIYKNGIWTELILISVAKDAVKHALVTFYLSPKQVAFSLSLTMETFSVSSYAGSVNRRGKGEGGVYPYKWIDIMIAKVQIQSHSVMLTVVRSFNAAFLSVRWCTDRRTAWRAKNVRVLPASQKRACYYRAATNNERLEPTLEPCSPVYLPYGMSADGGGGTSDVNPVRAWRRRCFFRIRQKPEKKSDGARSTSCKTSTDENRRN